MKELPLKYGCNPNQQPARVYMENGGELPLAVLNGKPGYINLLDAFNSFQLVRELSHALSLPAAASFKHVSPAGAAVGLPLSSTLRQMYHLAETDALSPLAAAFTRARGTDRLSSFGDWIALSDICDISTARLIKKEVSDGVIAPGYEDEALSLLKEKKKGAYTILSIDPAYVPDKTEKKQVFGITFEERRNDLEISEETMLSPIVSERKSFTPEEKRDLLLALITLKYTQSNSVCYAKDGQTIGVGAGQQSRIHCVRLAGNKADCWHLRAHPKVLSLPFKAGVSRAAMDNAIDVFLGNTPEDILKDGIWQTLFTKKPAPLTGEEKEAYLREISGVSLGSDAFFPFRDNIDRARRSGVGAIAAPGGSIRDGEIVSACNEYHMALTFCHYRLFHH